MKKILIYGGTICLFVILCLLFFYRFWPFATGSNASAFLGTTFEMSLPEVQRVLKKNGVQLVDYTKFSSIDQEIGKKNPFVKDLFQPLFAEDKLSEEKTQLWYMPSIDMFESQVVAEFTFKKNNLTFVQVCIFPISNPSHVVEVVTNELTSKYRLLQKETSKDVPGAYTLKFKNNLSNIDFWINLTEPNNPIISLFITYDKNISQESQEYKKREKIAF